MCELINTLKQYDKAYYFDNKSLVDDKVYDSKVFIK